MNNPQGIAVDSDGNLWIADRDNHRIRFVEILSGIITTVAGIGQAGFGGDGGPASSATLNRPEGVALDSLGNVYITDTGNHRIRVIRGGREGIIETVAGTGTRGFSGDNGAAIEAELSFPSRSTVGPLGNLVIADRGNHRIRYVNLETGVITTVAGSGEPSFSGEGFDALKAALNLPNEAILDASVDLFIVDQGNHRIRLVRKPLD